MADISTIKAEPRDRAGKGAARASRRAGLVPAVIYGEKKPPEMITIEARDLVKRVRTGRFLSTVFDVAVGRQTTRVIPRDIQFDPVKDFPLHVDFLRLAAGGKIVVDVPVRFLNEEDSRGIKRGGALNVVRYEIEVEAPSDSIPEHIDVDLLTLDIGDSLHISAVSLPDGVTPTIERDFTICSITAPVGDVDEEIAAEEAAAAAEAGEDEDAEDAATDAEGGDDAGDDAKDAKKD